MYIYIILSNNQNRTTETAATILNKWFTLSYFILSNNDHNIKYPGKAEMCLEQLHM